MLSIVKINSSKNQASQGSEGYLAYLGAPSTRERGDFDDYARGNDRSNLGPLPFWGCSGPALLGLDSNRAAAPEHVERLARGFHPLDGQALVEGAGDSHVMGVDMTFSAPKDVSAVFAAADRQTQTQILDCLHEAVRAALAHAEAHAITRHGHGGKVKKKAEAAVAACYTHFASRALDPQLHVHAFMFNVGKRAGADEWSALEHKAQFDRKMATGALFRVELAARLRAIGFAIEPAGPYFQIVGVSDEQREALSTRSREIAEQVAEMGDAGKHGEAAKDVAAINTRSAKSEPPLPELLDRFARQAAALGLTPQTVARMRDQTQSPDQTIDSPNNLAVPGIYVAPHVDFSLDRDALLATLMERQSCATPQDALAVICEMAMGRWDAERCLDELAGFMASDSLCMLGETETLAPIFTSRATLDTEARVARIAGDGKADLRHRLSAAVVNKRVDALEAELGAQIGAPVSLGEQRAAALHVASETGNHTFVEGWAGTGKTTLLRALADAYKESGFSVMGCAQSASAAQNLSRETSVPSRTIASLLLAIQSRRLTLNNHTVLVLDEAGMVGSREFALVQQAAVDAGAKLIAVGDSKQLQPIEAGGIFRALIREHGCAEISTIRRQRTDFEPLFDWLAERARSAPPSPADELSPAPPSAFERIQALRSLPDGAKMRAAEALCAADPALRRGFLAWRSRYDHEWMRDAVKSFAVGAALPALRLLDSRERLRLSDGPLATVETLLAEWEADKTPLAEKAMIAATRAEVADLNARARARLVALGIVRDSKGIEFEITRRDDSKEAKRFAPGDRIVFTKNDRTIGVANGSTGAIQKIERVASGLAMRVKLDAANERGDELVRVPASFGRLDHAYCLTNFKSQGRTLSSAHVLVNPSMADREWIAVATSRSRFATTLHVDRSAILSADPESHLQPETAEFDRSAAIECLARSMSRSHAKGTTLDYAVALGEGERGDTISHEEQEALTIDRQRQIEAMDAVARTGRPRRPRATQSMDNQQEARR